MGAMARDFVARTHLTGVDVVVDETAASGASSNCTTHAPTCSSVPDVPQSWRRGTSVKSSTESPPPQAHKPTHPSTLTIRRQDIFLQELRNLLAPFQRRVSQVGQIGVNEFVLFKFGTDRFGKLVIGTDSFSRCEVEGEGGQLRL